MDKAHERTGTEESAKAAWIEYIKHNKLPPGIPPNPDEIYADEWKGWCYWLGWVNAQSN